MLKVDSGESGRDSVLVMRRNTEIMSDRQDTSAKRRFHVSDTMDPTAER